MFPRFIPSQYEPASRKSGERGHSSGRSCEPVRSWPLTARGSVPGPRMARRRPAGRVSGLTPAAGQSVHFPAPVGGLHGIPRSRGGQRKDGCADDRGSGPGKRDSCRARKGHGSPACSPARCSARGHPCEDAAVLLASELSGNSVRHSGPGIPGKTVTVTAGTGVARAEVTDPGGPGVPELRRADHNAERGRGLQLVAGPAARRGWRRRGRRTVTWFEIQALLQPMQHSAVSDKHPPGCPPAAREVSLFGWRAGVGLRRRRTRRRPVRLCPR